MVIGFENFGFNHATSRPNSDYLHKYRACEQCCQRRHGDGACRLRGGVGHAAHVAAGAAVPRGGGLAELDGVVEGEVDAEADGESDGHGLEDVEAPAELWIAVDEQSLSHNFMVV